jgi:nitroreductase
VKRLLIAIGGVPPDAVVIVRWTTRVADPLPAPDPPFAGIPGAFAEITDHGALASRKFT